MLPVFSIDVDVSGPNQPTGVGGAQDPIPDPFSTTALIAVLLPGTHNGVIYYVLICSKGISPVKIVLYRTQYYNSVISHNIHERLSTRVKISIHEAFGTNR